MTPEDLMMLAIDAARQGITRGQSPFGCAIAKDDQVIAVCHNTVLHSGDITAHAEINAIRTACRQLNDIFLHDCVVASTCEPCPMCISALHWARVRCVYYGATIAHAQKSGFNELQVPAAQIIRLGQSRVQLNDGVLLQECSQLFEDWLDSPQRKAY